MSLRTLTKGLGPAFSIVALIANDAHADYDTLRYVEFPGKGKNDQGIVVRLHSMDRYEGGGDNDWTFKFGPAACDGELYGRECTLELDRFLELFWDEGQSSFRKLAGAFIRHFAKRNQKELAAAGALSTCKDDGVSGDCRKLYGQILANYKLWDRFSDHKVYRNWVADKANWDWDAGNCNKEWCTGSDFKPSAEVTLRQNDKAEELVDAATRREKGRSIYEFFREGGTSSASRLKGKNVLFHGMLAIDYQHPRAGITGKMEIHPIHGIVFRDRSYHFALGGQKTWDPDPTTTVISLADAGKASGSGTDWPVFINYVYEEWPDQNRPYFVADLSFLNQPQPAKLLEKGVLEVGVKFGCDRVMIDNNGGYTAAAFGLVSPPVVPGLGRCPTHNFAASFHTQPDPVDVFWLTTLTLGIGGAFVDYLPHYPFVNSGWAVHEFTPSWTTAIVTSQLQVTKVVGFKADPALFPGIPPEGVDVYDATFSFGNLPKFGKEAVFQPASTHWKLPANAKVISTKDWIQKAPDGSVSAGGSSMPQGGGASSKAEKIRFAMVRAPERNPTWIEYQATVQATTTVKAGAKEFPMETLPANADRSVPETQFVPRPENQKFRIETKQINFSEGLKPAYSLCSPDWKTRIIYEPVPSMLYRGFVADRNSGFINAGTTWNAGGQTIAHEWRRGNKVLSTGVPYSGKTFSISSDDPFLEPEYEPSPDEQYVVSVFDKSAGGPLERVDREIDRDDLGIPVTKLVFAPPKGMQAQKLSDPPTESLGSKMYPGCNNNASKMTVKTFPTFQLDAALTIPSLAKSAYRDAKGNALPSIQCVMFAWTVEIMDDDGKWVPFSKLKGPPELSALKKSGYLLSESDSRITIYTSGKRLAFRLHVKARDAYGREDEETMVVNNWWAEWPAKKKIDMAGFLEAEAFCLQQKAADMKKLNKLQQKQFRRVDSLLEPVSIKGGVIDPAPWMSKAAGSKSPVASTRQWSNTHVAQRFADIQKMKQALGLPTP